MKHNLFLEQVMPEFKLLDNRLKFEEKSLRSMNLTF